MSGTIKLSLPASMMNRLNLSHEIIQSYNNRSNSDLYAEGVKEFVVPALKMRKEDDIFTNDKSLAGIEVSNNADFITTFPASPHVDSSIAVPLFLDKLISIYSERANLCIVDKISQQTLPPHLIVWWRQHDQVHTTLPDIPRLSETMRSNLFKGITMQTIDAVSLITELSCNAHIAGTWGYTPVSERLKSGLSRGGSTNSIGHLHIADYTKDYKSSSLAVKLNLEDKIKFFRPLDLVLQDLLAPIIACSIQKIASKQGIDLSILGNQTKILNSEEYFFDGFRLDFKNKLDFSCLLEFLTKIGENFEYIYNTLKDIYREYWCGFITYTEIYTKVNALVLTTGVEDSEQINILVDLLVSLSPTRSQLVQWNVDVKKIEKYDRIRKLIEKTGRHLKSVVTRYIYDMTRLSEDTKDILFTMPERMSFGYLLQPKDIELISLNEDKKIYVNSFHLFPVFATTSTLIERYPGGIIRRAGS